MAKESSASRRARVKFQLRDKKGRWIEMGRGVKWYSPRLGREVSGTVVGSKGRNAIVNITSEPAGVTGKPQQVSVKGTDIEVIANKASIGAPAPKPSKQKVPTEKAKIADDGGKGVTPEMQKEIDRQLGRGDQKDEANPAVAVDEDEDLEDIDLDDDLDVEEEVDDSGADEDVDTSPTDIDALEATIEELEAVVEEVTSGDLDAAEIEAKLEEEVYSVYGNDGKQYDLDVKKDLEGKWNYRLRDAEGKARKIHAMVPADENDSVDAGAKLDAAMNPKTKAKATTAKPKAEEKAPEADAVSETERNIDQFKPERVLPKNREGQYSSGADFETKHLTEEDIARLPVGTDIKGVDYDDRLFGEYFTKLADDSWITPHSDMANDAHMVEHGEWTQGIFLPGNENNDNTPESLAADLDRYGRTWAPNQKNPNAPAEDKAPEVDSSGSDTKKTVEAPKDTTPVPEGEQDELFPAPKSKAPGKNATDMKKELDALPDDTRIHFSDAMGENSEVYQKVTTNPDEGKPKTLWAKVGIDESDDDGRLEVLDGSSYKKPGQLEKEREALNSAGIAKKHAGRKFETDSAAEPEAKGHMAPVKHRPPIKGDNKAGSDPDAAPESEDEEEEPLDDDDDFETDEEIWLDAQETNRWNTKYNFNREQKEAYEDAIRAAEAEAGPEAYKDRPKWAETIKRHFDAAAEAKAAAKSDTTASEGVADMLNWRMKMRPEAERGMEIDEDNNVTVTDPKKAEQIFNETLGDTQGASNRSDVAGRADVEAQDEILALREALGVPDTRTGAARFTPRRGEPEEVPESTEVAKEAPAAPEATPEAPETAEAPATPKADSDAPAAPQTAPGRMTRDELLKEVTDLEIKGAKAAGTGDYELSPADAKRRADLRKELDTREGEAPTETTPEDETDEGATALASVGVERTEPRALPGEKFAPTRQQQDVIDAVMAGKDTVVQAKAGAGKTTTLQAIAARVAEASPDKKIVYVAFNSSVQKEAEARMPGNVEARTGHSIGFGWVGKDVTDRYKGENGHVRLELDEDVAKHIGITGTYKGDPGSDDSTLYPEDIAAAAMLTVDKFAYNAEDDINEDHLPDSMFGTSPEAKTAVIDAANKIWADVNAPDGKIKLTQDHMRKMWALSRPDFGQTGAGLRRKADMLFIDEAQDTPPVLAKVIADQKMQKVIVGDADQAIYAFSGATDFLSKAEKDLELPLNRSWRFGAPVADAGNRFLQLLGSKGRVVGGGNSKISEGKMQDADAVLVRTNAGALAEMVEEGARGRIVGVEKKTIDKFKSAADTMDWLKSKNKGQTPIPKPQKVLPELAAYKDWSHVERENEKGDKPNLAMYVRLDSLYGSNGIRDALKNVVAVDSKSPGKASKGIGGNLNGVVMDDNGKTTVAGGSSSATFLNKDDLKEAGFRYRPDPSGELMRSGKNKGEPKKSWQALGTPEERAATVKRFADRIGSGYNPDEPDAEPTKPDVIISTAHKAKGLEWGKVRIGGDFPQPKLNKATGKMVMPDPENLRLAYVAVTRAEAELDPGSLGYVYEHTKENGGTPEPADKPAEQNEVTEPPISAADDSDFVPESDDRVADTEAGAAPEAPQAPEADEVADESVPEAAPEAPEAAPEPVEAPEPTPAPAATPEPVETPEESAPTDTTPDPATPVDGLDEDGLTPDEAAYVAKLNKAIADGYRTGMGNVKALGERLDEMYARGAARLRGEDPDAVPEVKPAENKGPTTPEAKEEVVPEAEEVAEEAPAPTPEAPAEAEAEPVKVVESPTEDGPQGDASDGEEVAEGGPTDLDSFEATASELFETFTNAQKTPRTPAELQDILDEEVYLLIGKDGVNYEFGLSIDDKGKWHYVLSDDDGNELERYNVITVASEEAGQKAFERVNGSRDSEAPEEAPVDPADATPEAEEEIVEDADRVEPEEAPEIDPEVVPEPAPMPEVEVEEGTAPEAQTPEEAPQETPETAPEGGTAPAEPDTRPLHPVKQKAHNYPDGTQIKAARTDELIEKTKGKWHVAGSPSKAADPMSVEIPLVVEMPAQDDDSFTPFDGNIDSLVPGDIIRTQSGDQAAVIGIREGKVMAMAHGVPANRKALRPNTVSVDPSKIKGVNKFDAPAPEEEAPTAPAVSRTRTKSAGGTPIMDVDGNETKLGDRVMTAIGQGEVIALRPKSGPNGSVLVRMDDGKEKSFRSNKFTNAAFAELLEADDPATMVVGSQGTAEDGRKFLVGSGNKPIFKGDRVALSDGRIGTVAGIYAGAKSAGVTLEDGTTTRKRVSTLDAIDYTAPEKDTTVAEEPTPETAPEVETTVEAPEVEAVVEEETAESDPAVQPDASEEWANTKLSQDAKRVFDEHGLTPSQLRSLVAANSPDSAVNGRTGRDSLSDIVSGKNTEDLWEASQTVTGVRSLAVIMSIMKTYNPNMDSSAAEGVDLDAFAKSIGALESKYSKAYKDTLKSLADVSPTKMTPAEIASYNAEVDFSGFDPSTSKLNPLSDAGKSFGDVKNRDQDAKPEGVKVRNKQTGALGMVRGSTSDGEAYVSQAGVTGPGGPDTLGQVSWSDLELVDVSAQVGTPDIAGATDNEGVAAAMSEAFPSTHFDFEGMTTDGAKQYAETMTRLFNKFPQSRLSVMQVISENAAPSQNADAVARGLTGAAMATTWTGNVRATGHAVQRIEVNAASEKDIHRSHRSSERFHNHIDEGKGMEYTITHEFGHALDGQTGWTSRETIEGFLKQLYPNFKAGRDEYKLLYKEFSGYSFNRKTGRVDPKEIVAEAFADAELNATEAKPLSKLIHQYLMERLREV